MEVTIEVLFSPRLHSVLEDKPDGVEVHILPVRMQRDYDFTPVATVVMNFASNVAAGLFVHWLLKKIPERMRKKITIPKREATWDEDELIKIIEEELKKEDEDDSDAE